MSSPIFEARLSGPVFALKRRAVVADILGERGKSLLVVAGLGSPCWDVAASGDDDRNFYVWGAMGSACMVALGIAAAQPGKRVLAIVGDGEMLMGLGSLATIATHRPDNLAILVLDNERYGETGNQLTHTASGADISGVARSCGFPLAYAIADADGQARAKVDLLNAAGPVVVVAKISLDPAPLVLPPRDGGYLKVRFRQALLGSG